MAHKRQFYIDGGWVEPTTGAVLDVINPATEEAYTQIALGSPVDVDRAVAAARSAFESFSLSTKADRLALLRAILAEYLKRYDDMAQAIMQEMGPRPHSPSPTRLAPAPRIWSG